MICKKCHKEIGNATECPYCGSIVLMEPLPHHLPVGTLIGGRFSIEGVLGEGGFGITYLTRDSKLGSFFAIKEYYPRGISYRDNTGTNEVYVSSKDDTDFYIHGKERFLSEARTLARFSEEPGVVSVMDYIEENDTVYLVMEYLRGETLQNYLKGHSTLHTDEAFTMLEPVIKTLEKIHSAGVIHRDISPDNIMVLKNGRLKLMDFGAAKKYIDDNHSMSVMLKKGYAPMEQYRRNGKQGPWTDVYAMCATIYRCITGKTPDDALDRVVEDNLPKPSVLGSDITPEREDVLMYGLEVHHQDRCQDMTELLRLWYQSGTSGIPERNATTPSVSSVKPVGNVVIVGSHLKPNKTVYADGNQVDPNATVYADDSFIGSSPESKQQSDSPKKKIKKGIVIGVIATALVIVIVMCIIMIKPVANKNSISTVEREGITERTVAEKWSNIVKVSAGYAHTVGLKRDGTVVATGQNIYGQCNVENWKDISEIVAGKKHTVGLKKDGRVVATGNNDSGQCNVDTWSGIISISVGEDYTVGLKDDGTVVATGDNNTGQCNIDDWVSIISLSAGEGITLGIKADGSVMTTYDNEDVFSVVSGWTDVTKAAVARNRLGYNIVGLKSDGTVENVGLINYGNDWKNLVAVCTGWDHSVGLVDNGTVVAAGDNEYGQCDVSDWTGVIDINIGDKYTIGLKDDGTVMTTGYPPFNSNDVSDWNDITMVTVGNDFIIGLKNDGTVIATGGNSSGQCNV